MHIRNFIQSLYYSKSKINNIIKFTENLQKTKNGEIERKMIEK